MQHTKEEYNAKIHDKWKALSVRQPDASSLFEPGEKGLRTVLIKRRGTIYRGDVLICSKAAPIVEDKFCGSTIGLLELKAVKPVDQMTEEEWQGAQVEDRSAYKYGCAWVFSNPRRVVEYPVSINKRFTDLFFDKGEIIEYPHNIEIDRKGWKQLKKEMK